MQTWNNPVWEVWREYRGVQACAGRYQSRVEAEAGKRQLARLWQSRDNADTWTLTIRYTGSDIQPFTSGVIRD